MREPIEKIGSRVIEFDKETGVSEVGSVSLESDLVFDEMDGIVYNAQVQLPDNWEQKVTERFIEAARRTITNIKGEVAEYNQKGYAKEWAYEYIQDEAEDSAVTKSGIE